MFKYCYYSQCPNSLYIIIIIIFKGNKYTTYLRARKALRSFSLHVREFIMRGRRSKKREFCTLNIYEIARWQPQASKKVLRGNIMHLEQTGGRLSVVWSRKFLDSLVQQWWSHWKISGFVCVNMNFIYLISTVANLFLVEIVLGDWPLKLPTLLSNSFSVILAHLLDTWLCEMIWTIQ